MKKKNNGEEEARMEKGNMRGKKLDRFERED